jgi:hypothetical protein
MTTLILPALEGSQLRSFAYDGKRRVLEIEFRVNAPFAYNGVPLPPPPRVIQYYEVPRYVLTKLLACKTGRRQERYWEDHIRRRFRCQTVRTVCRVPRVWRFIEARNIRRFSFEDYSLRLSREEQQSLQLVVAAMRVLLLRTLAPKRAAGLGGLIECQGCGSVGAPFIAIRHRNCLWAALFYSH